LIDVYLSRGLDKVGEASHWSMVQYNEQRPYDFLDDLTPLEYSSKNA